MVNGDDRARPTGRVTRPAVRAREVATRQRRKFAACMAVVVVTDQVTKWWAWRNVDHALINRGGYILLGDVIRSWFSGSVTGAVADVAGCILLLLGARQLLTRPRPTAMLVGGAMFIAGWISNLADRLGLHNVTAPGSLRGVVDFIPSGGSSRCNVADLWIAVGAVLFMYGLVRRSSNELHDVGRLGSLVGSWPIRITGLATVAAVAVLAVIAA